MPSRRPKRRCPEYSIKLSNKKAALLSKRGFLRVAYRVARAAPPITTNTP
jgi:hypothetical protein